MRQMPIVTAAALVILTAAAAAQTGSTPRPAASPSATTPAPRMPSPNPLSKEAISGIDGVGVYGNDNDKIGHISDVLMDPLTRKIDRLVVTSGGVLGVGGHRVAIPVDQFKWDGGRNAFTLPMTMAGLKAIPEWVEGADTATGSTALPGIEKPTSSGAGNSGK